MSDDRIPYVGRGADGARRSAQIDREEADGYDRDDPRHARALASAERWDAQAERLSRQPTPIRNLVVIDAPPAPPRGPCRVTGGPHRWAWLVSGGQACGYCKERRR